MSIICPTILAQNAEDFKYQLNKVLPFASRIQIDLMDGEFTNTKSLDLKDVWLPKGILDLRKITDSSGLIRGDDKAFLSDEEVPVGTLTAEKELYRSSGKTGGVGVLRKSSIICDIHLMYKNPQDYIGQLIKLNPSMVIVHAESDCDIPLFASELRDANIKTGLAVLQGTEVEGIRYILPHVQHLLIFSGYLGHFGGLADLSLANKIIEAKKTNRHLEIGWDGGANINNIKDLANAGVNVINVGGALQNVSDPATAYAKMEAELTKITK